MKNYVEIFSSLLTPLIAILSVCIAWQHYQINHSSLRNALYERRLKVFNAFMSFLTDTVRQGWSDHQRVMQFYGETSEAVFLFDAKVVDKAEELYNQGIELDFLHEQLDPCDGGPGLPIGSERNRVVQEQIALRRWFVEQIKEVRELFKKQMQVKVR